MKESRKYELLSGKLKLLRREFRISLFEKGRSLPDYGRSGRTSSVWPLFLYTPGELVSFILCLSLVLITLFGSGCSDSENHFQNPSPDADVNIDPPIAQATDASTDTEASVAPYPDTSDWLFETSGNGYAEHSLLFPNNMSGKDASNSSVYSISPFNLTFVLPEGWYCLSHPTVPELYLGAKNGSETGIGVVYSIYWIYNQQDVCVGAVGYDLYRASGEHRNDPNTIYSSINQDDGYRFATNEYYFPVSNNTGCVTALTQIYISSEWLRDFGIQKPSDRLQVGILSYDVGCGAFVAFHFFPSMLTSLEIMDIAGSLSFQRVN